MAEVKTSGGNGEARCDVYPDGGVVSSTYDAAGRMTAITAVLVLDGNFSVVTFYPERWPGSFEMRDLYRSMDILPWRLRG